MQEVIFRPTWLNVVFEKRNQAYGAYILRQEYEKNRILGLILGLGLFGGIFLLAIGAQNIASNFNSGTNVAEKKDDYFVHEFINPNIEPIKEEPAPQVEQPEPNTVQHSDNIRVVSDNQATTTIATTDELAKAEAGPQTVEGSGTTLPLDGTGQGTIPVVAPIEDIPVDIAPLDFADKMPTFPGMSSYLGSKINFSNLSLEGGRSGRVVLEFIVDENGNIVNPQVIKGFGYGCDEEALRVVANMPKWIPGEQNGKKVKVKIKLPIMFKSAD